MPAASPSPWRELFLAERDAVLAERIRWCVLMNTCGVVFWTGQTLLTASNRPAGLAFAFVGLVLAFVAWRAARLPSLAGRARGFAVGYICVLAVTMTAALSLTDSAESAAAAFVTLNMGTAFVLPWGLGAQAIVCAVGAVGYVVVVSNLQHPAFTSMFMVLTSIPIAVVGAKLLDDYRASSFEHVWRQGQLLSLARELARHMAPEHVAATVLEWGRRLLGADGGAVAVHDRQRRAYRVEAAAGDPERAEAVRGVEFPDDLPLIERMAVDGALELVGGQSGSPFAPLLAASGMRRVLCVPIQYGGERVGVVTFSRMEDRMFAPHERELARGLADQAATALRTTRLVAALKHANELKSIFVSTMSHELRTPLNVIIGFAEMARDPDVPGHERTERLASIEGAGRELLSMIESTLEVGRIEAGREEVRLERIDLPALWTDLATWCDRLPRHPGVELVWASRVPPVELVTDPRKLTMVVRNLVGNACKFTERGRVTVSVGEDGDAVLIRVADTGVGIAPADQGAVFEMFRQADGSDTRRFGGTGLGLYIVRRFVEQLGGIVTLESEPGRGSDFSIRLPRVTAAGADVRAA